MALSVQKLRNAPVTSLGFVTVATPGTPVPLSINIDANNTNAPGTANPPPAQFPSTGTEWSPNFRGFAISGFKPGANNNGMVPNSGYVYLLTAPAAGGSGNRSDSGSIVGVILPGTSFFFPPSGTSLDLFSPYTLYLDADTANDGGLVVAYGAGGQ